MKETRIRYGVTALAIIGILVAFIGYTTDTPVETEVKQSPAKTGASVKSPTSTRSAMPSKKTITSTKVEPSCGCCAERKALTRRTIDFRQAVPSSVVSNPLVGTVRVSPATRLANH